MKVYYDLHIHTALSPCGDNDMTPCNIVGLAALCGSDVIAVTDHNSALNCAAVEKAGREAGIIVLSGMELETAEEVHVVFAVSVRSRRGRMRKGSRLKTVACTQ